MDGVQTILSYPFKSPAWQSKFVTAVVISLGSFFIPILPGLLLMGYCARITQSIINEHAELILPEWNDWGDYLSRGVKVFGAMLLFLLPILFLLIGGYFIMTVAAIANVIISALGSHNVTTIAVILQLLGSLVGVLMFALGFLLVIPLSLMAPPAIAHVIAKNSFSAVFHIKQWWKIARANLWGFVTALILVSGVYIFVVLIMQALYLTVLLCFLIPFVLCIFSAYISLVSAAALGEAYRKGVENLAAAA